LIKHKVIGLNEIYIYLFNAISLYIGEGRRG